MGAYYAVRNMDIVLSHSINAVQIKKKSLLYCHTF